MIPERHFSHAHLFFLFRRLVKILVAAVQEEDNLLKKSSQLTEQLQSGGVKNYNQTLNALNTVSEKIVQTDSKRLNAEREIKAQSEKAIQVMKLEVDEQNKLKQAIDQYSVNLEELAYNYNRLSQKVDIYNSQIKGIKNDQKALSKEYKEGSISVLS